MRVLSLAAVSFLIAGCGTHILDFDVSQDIPQQTIPGQPIVGTIATVGPAFTFNIDLQAEAKAHDTGPIGSVHLKSITLVIDPSSQTQNFDWLHELHLYIESTQQGSTLPKVEIAQLTTVPKGVTSISLVVMSDVDVKPYIDQGPKITSTATASSTPGNIVFEGTMVFRVSPL